MDTILQPILHSPRLKQYVDDLSSYLQTEEERRQQFYATMTEQEKVEFINGEVVYHSPVILKHNQVGKRLLVLLNTFVYKYQLGFIGYEKILIKLTRNDFEPDLCFFKKEVANTFSDKTMFFPAPHFIAEILSASTKKNDRGVKFEDYAFHGVMEYWIIDPENETVEQYLLDDKRTYQLNVKLKEGVIHANAVEGFSIEISAIFDDAICNNTLKKII